MSLYESRLWEQVMWVAYKTLVPYFLICLQYFFKSSLMYPENREERRLIVGSINMGYDIYPTLPGFEHATCSITSEIAR